MFRLSDRWTHHDSVIGRAVPNKGKQAEAPSPTVVKLDVVWWSSCLAFPSILSASPCFAYVLVFLELNLYISYARHDRQQCRSNDALIGLKGNKFKLVSH